MLLLNAMGGESYDKLGEGHHPLGVAKTQKEWRSLTAVVATLPNSKWSLERLRLSGRQMEP